MQKFHRQAEMLDIVRQKGSVTVAEMARRFGVSEQIIRKDLKVLSGTHNLIRFHGGASAPIRPTADAFEARRAHAGNEKRAIASTIAGLIPHNSSLFINFGTTTEQIAAALMDHESIKVLTDNVNMANMLRVNPEIEVVVAGGVVRGSDGAIVGEAAVDFIRRFKADFGIIGATAIDADGALLDHDFREVKVVQEIMARSLHVILAADSSKFGNTAAMRIAGLDQIDTFVTDRCSSRSVRAICARHDVRLIETERSDNAGRR